MRESNARAGRRVDYYPQLLHYIGRAQQGSGSSAAADSYRSFLEIKRQSDPDPLVDDARRRLSAC